MGKPQKGDVSARALARLKKLTEKKDWFGLIDLAGSLVQTSQSAIPVFALAQAYFHIERFDLAAQAAQAVHDANPGAQEPAALLALIHALVGNLPVASYFRKLEMVASNPDPELQPLKSAALPPFELLFLNVSDRILFQKGLADLNAGNARSAEDYLRQQLFFTPDDQDVHLGLVRALLAQQAWAPAINLLLGMRHRWPGNALITGELGTALLSYGRREEGLTLLAEAVRQAPGNPELDAFRLQMQAHGYDDAGFHAIAAPYARWGATHAIPDAPPAPEFAAPGSGPLVVGCLLGAAAGKARNRAFANLLIWINNREVRLIGFGNGELSHPANNAFQSVLSEWTDISDADPLTVLQIVRTQRCDILLDLAGLDMPVFAQVLQHRAAPVQLSWAPLAASLGQAALDGFISDRWCQAGRTELAEPALQLEQGALLDLLPSADLPLPERDPAAPVVLGINAGFIEMTPATLALWARILHDLPEATLLVRDHQFTLPENTDRLRELFAPHGLTHRVEVVSEADAESFLAQTDILLTAPPATDGLVLPLWMGCLPVVLTGENRLSREALSLFAQTGLEDCVATSPEAYVAQTLRLARDADLRARLTTGLRERISSAPLFDPALRAADLTRLLQAVARPSSDTE